MGGSLLGFCVTHHPGLAIIFVGCGDCPENTVPTSQLHITK